MYEKVSICHPDKIADRIGGAIVDLAYKKAENPKIALEILIGHKHCHIINETSERFSFEEISSIVHRIAGEDININYLEVPQDEHLAKNQEGKIRCGDNGIFKGVPMTNEEKELANIAGDLYSKYHSDGKYILDNGKLIICQSNAKNDDLRKFYPNAIINPLGEWKGGLESDTGAINRKLGSDMGCSVTGGGLHGKDCSKADISVNIYAWLKAQAIDQVVEISCAIGDEIVDGRPYSEIVEIARKYINGLGGFEKFAEWGFIRPNFSIEICYNK